MAKRIGILTGGGDCPGLNAVIRAIVRKGEGVYGHEILGFRHGWRGVLDNELTELTGIRYACSPSASLSALVSVESFNGVPVPWAQT